MRLESFTRDREFHVAGLGLTELARLSSTPFYAYSGDAIRASYARLQAALPDFEVFYSLKANPHPDICRLLRSVGARAEVSAVGELRTVLRAGFRGRDIILLGPGKTGRELRAALDARVYAVVVDCAEELIALDALAARRDARPGVMLRINTAEQPTGAKEVMVGGPGKFGFDEELVVDAMRKLKLRRVRLLGIQVYFASQVLDAEVLGRHLEYVARLAEQVSEGIGFRLRAVDFGGGFGVPCEAGQAELNLSRVSRSAQQVLRRHPTLKDCRLMVESGRYLVAESGVFVTRVIRVKESRGKRLIIADGGMNHFARPVFMRVAHQARNLTRLAEPHEQEYDICGPLCTPIDVLAAGCRLPETKPGDLLGIFDAGAYGYSMSLLHFLSLGLPGEILVDRGQVVSVRRRSY